jgi:hypothetical protein
MKIAFVTILDLNLRGDCSIFCITNPAIKLITITLMKIHELNTPQKYVKERKSWRRKIPLRITITCNEENFGTSPS